jgi:hypothetical protein
MSRVTNVILTFSVIESCVDTPTGLFVYDLMTPVNEWLIANGYGAFGPDADQVAGGHKHLEAPLYVAGFNHFVLDAFVAMLRDLPWDEPEAVQLFIKDQEDLCFRVVHPCAAEVFHAGQD